MYYYLHVMSDDALDDFYINDPICRAKLFDEMKSDFDTYGPISKQRVLDAIQFILSSVDIEKFWRYVVPQEVPLDEVEDKFDYLRTLYRRLTENYMPLKDIDSDVELVAVSEKNGIDVRL